MTSIFYPIEPDDGLMPLRWYERLINALGGVRGKIIPKSPWPPHRTIVRYEGIFVPYQVDIDVYRGDL